MHILHAVANSEVEASDQLGVEVLCAGADSGGIGPVAVEMGNKVLPTLRR